MRGNEKKKSLQTNLKQPPGWIKIKPSGLNKSKWTFQVWADDFVRLRIIFSQEKIPKQLELKLASNIRETGFRGWNQSLFRFLKKL